MLVVKNSLPLTLRKSEGLEALGFRHSVRHCVDVLNQEGPIGSAVRPPKLDAVNTVVGAKEKEAVDVGEKCLLIDEGVAAEIDVLD